MSIALISETQKDLEEVMVPRILGLYGDHDRPRARMKPVRIDWPNGAIAFGYNGTEPDQLRGPEFDTAWVDELAKYKRARMLWDMLQFTMRSSDTPQVCVTTTPRPIPVLKEIIADKTTVMTKGSTFENQSNLPAKFLQKLRNTYSGTRLGRQELEAEILDDIPGALWTRESFDPPDSKEFMGRVKDTPELQRIVVSVDPSGTKGSSGDVEKSNDVGIVVAGLGIDGRGYVLADWTCNLSPDGWGRRAVAAFHEFSADRIVAETNFGGAMVEHVVKTIDKDVPYKEVRASRGKVARAEPVAALYEQGRVSHVGSLKDLEDQMCEIGPEGFIGEGSPDRVDAVVWGLTELMLGETSYNLMGAL
jgi:phage terminase large subunit-like protein